MGLHDVLDDRQPEYGATERAAAALVDPVKPLEKSRQMGRLDAAPLVLHRDLQRGLAGIVRSQAGRHADRVVGLAGLDRVVDQVDQCLLY